MVITTKWRWIVEYQTNSVAVIHMVKNLLYSGSSKYQNIDVIETEDYGTCLVLDGKIQSATVDEFIYHEALVHPAMTTHPSPEVTLIIGGGEGATAREVLKHKIVKRVVMVDLDEEVVQVSRKYIPQLSAGAFEDKRLNLIFDDGRAYLEKSREKYDVIIIDVTDPLRGGPSYLLYTKQFYELVRRSLNPDGIMVTQATSTFYSRKSYTVIYNTIRQVFPITRAYSAWIPSYISSWGFVLASLKYDPLALTEDEIKARLSGRGVIDLKFYSSEYHKPLFALPTYLRKALEEEKDVATDENPTFMPA
ncbi:MAG: polyamine aminopropyltransferase [Candidatus Nezhaarchaeota archaeon]|nr:polyamine aminopropyltransferase [Candidatus Nezhaarchaeota archaeon]MCX8142100.1 polyamine aminopropyltransferase [Candidatus Nezhaarchaeota archaeon]MDW8050119.1 polyamine aminopropyltransferase [Nitrososphaerota archaeon]